MMWQLVLAAVDRARRAAEDERRPPFDGPLRLTRAQAEALFAEQDFPLPDDWDTLAPTLPLVLGLRVELVASVQDGTLWTDRPEERPVFACPVCGRTTPHPQDVANRYCPSCHWPTGDPWLGPARPELWQAYGRTPPDFPEPVTRDAPMLGATPHGMWIDEPFPNHPGRREDHL
ncbi:hypothetical protein [Saccharothrix sp. HUAS TT1]|uniref:hypothetical protein n=1 Tax=unclassified Saccharothrix TaxID=2593673 RepID=UPI00345BB22D